MGRIDDNVVKTVASEFKIPPYNFYERVHLIVVLFLSLIMSTDRMKGLLKGLRYISNIFEPEDKETEMKIGFPTDVKHVAHVGWDDHSMNEGKSESGDQTSSERPTPHRNQHPRRPPSSNTNSSDRDKSESSRRGRRERNITAGEGVTQNETSSSSSSSSALQDQSVVALKQARRRKAKGSSSSSGTSARSSRSKEQQLPLPDPTREEEEEKEGG